MKNFIYCLIFMLTCININSNAQISSVHEHTGFTVINKWSEPASLGVVPVCNLIKTEDGVYELRFYSQNQFEDKYVMLILGNSKDKAIDTVEMLIGLFKKTVKNKPITIKDIDNNEITIYKSMGFYYLNQPGIAKSVRTGYATNAITIGMMNKVIKSIKNDND